MALSASSVPDTFFKFMQVLGFLEFVLRYRERFPQNATFSGKLRNYLFMGKGIRIEGVELADFLNLVPIPQNATLSEEV